MGNLLGLGSVARDVGGAVRDVSEVFTENKTERAQHQHQERIATLDQFSAEFQQARSGWFDRLVDGVNRLPRPFMALATMGLFAYAMADPIGFAARMQGLALVPEPLWWLMGAVVSFYFGARELHHSRRRRLTQNVEDVRAVTENIQTIQAMMPPTGVSVSDNPVLADWLREQN